MMEEMLEVAKNAFPSMQGIKYIHGLNENVEILWDKWGIPHIFANNIYDLYFSQGYIHASHRLWQMETFRRLISGTLSEITGEGSLTSDKHYRELGLYQIAQICSQNLREDKKSNDFKFLDSYIKGVNKRIHLVQNSLPIEFHILNFKPEDWTLADSFKIISMIEWSLSNWNYPYEILREYLTTRLGKKTTNQVISFNSEIEVDESVGSNAWAVNPDKSETGTVLLANDPHLPLTNPALWFLMHLHCPELNATGTSLPGVPAIIIGHNESIAWGLTNVMADTTDLFKLTINPKNESQYRYNGNWTEFERKDEIIHIRGNEKPIIYPVFRSKFGPVIHYFEKNNKIYPFFIKGTYALRWSSFDAELINNLKGFKGINRAKNWQEFREALSFLTINPQNFIYGDIEGNIGHQHGGKIPVRKHGNGGSITPGDDEKYDWKGISTFDQLFSLFNPKRGFVYTANYNVEKAPNGLLIAEDRIAPYRQLRLKKLLQVNNKLSIDDFKAIQLDRYTEEAAQLVPIMLKYLKISKNLDKFSKAIDILEKWDYFLTKKSIGGTIYKVWYSETQKILLEKIMDKKVANIFRGSRPFNLKRILESNFVGSDEETSRLLFKALENALDYLATLFGVDIKKWKWGVLHTLTLTHPFSHANKKAKILNVGPFKLGGDGNTLNPGSYDPSQGYIVLSGPSYRQIHDLSNWDNSIGALPGGQSGLPFHKHYKDLIKLWVKGKYIPFLFTKKAISDNLESKLTLKPK
jgi:penicillin amidase